MASENHARSGRHRRLAGIAAWVVIGGLPAACQSPGENRRAPDADAEARGLALIESVGCGACHDIPGVDWPKGRLGPSLVGFSDVGLIAGALPNRPGTLAAFIRNAPSVKPGSTMPPMPLTDSEAADVAAYLYGIDRD